ncbi:MAG: hypothetical protein WDN09_03525 [bacterium]
MKKNLVLFMILIVVAAAPAGAVRAEGEDTDAKIESGVTSFFPRAWAWIVDHTPAFIQNSIRSAYAVTEDFRLDLDRKLDAKKTDLEAELVIPRRGRERGASDFSRAPPARCQAHRALLHRRIRHRPRQPDPLLRLVIPHRALGHTVSDTLDILNFVISLCAV